MAPLRAASPLRVVVTIGELQVLLGLRDRGHGGLGDETSAFQLPFLFLLQQPAALQRAALQPGARGGTGEALVPRGGQVVPSAPTRPLAAFCASPWGVPRPSWVSLTTSLRPLRPRLLTWAMTWSPKASASLLPTWMPSHSRHPSTLTPMATPTASIEPGAPGENGSAASVMAASEISSSPQLRRPRPWPMAEVPRGRSRGDLQHHRAHPREVVFAGWHEDADRRVAQGMLVLVVMEKILKPLPFFSF